MTDLDKAQAEVLRLAFELGKLSNQITNYDEQGEDAPIHLMNNYHVTRLNLEVAADQFAQAYHKAHNTEEWQG